MTELARRLGRTIGRAIALDVIAEDMPREWTGLDAVDGDLLLAAGMVADSDEWQIAETTAEAMYRIAITKAKGANHDSQYYLEIPAQSY